MDEWERTLRKTLQSHAQPIEAAPDLAAGARTRSRARRARQMFAVAAVVPVVLAAAGYGVAAALPGGPTAVVPAGPPTPSKPPAWMNSVGCGTWSTPVVKIYGSAVANGKLPAGQPVSASVAFFASAYYRHLEARYGRLDRIVSDFQLTGAGSAPFDRWVVGGTSKRIVTSVVVQVSSDRRWSAVPVKKTGCQAAPVPPNALRSTLPTCAPTGHASTELVVRAINGLGGVHFTAPCLYAPAGQPLRLSIIDDAYYGGTHTPILLDHLYLYRASDVSKVDAYGSGPDTAVATLEPVSSGRRTMDVRALPPGRYVIYGLGSFARLTMLIVR